MEEISNPEDILYTFSNSELIPCHNKVIRGSKLKIKGNGNIVIGDDNIIIGNDCIIVGNKCKVKGRNNIIEGLSNDVDELDRNKQYDSEVTVERSSKIIEFLIHMEELSELSRAGLLEKLDFKSIWNEIVQPVTNLQVKRKVVVTQVLEDDDEDGDDSLLNWNTHTFQTSTSSSRKKRKANKNELKIPDPIENEDKGVNVPESKQCIICMSREIKTTFVSCGHCSMCVTCAIKFASGKNKKSVECPQCKSKVSRIIRIYYK